MGPTPSPFASPCKRHAPARSLANAVRKISAMEVRERQKSVALDLISDSVVAVDPQGRITYLNHAAERLYGWRRAEILDRDAKTVLFADARAFEEAWHRLRDEGEWCGEIAQRMKQGEERLVSSRWSLVRDRQSNRIQSILMIGTESSKLNLKAAEFAHEIRNPLAGIKGVADAFLRRRELSCQEREWMEAVRYAVVGIDARMRELLDVSQTRVPNLKQCSLSELVRGVVVLAAHQAQSINEQHGRQISVQFIDAVTEPLIMHLDPARIEDAVLNLVVNAIEAIEESGQVTVCLRRRSTNGSGDGEAVIEVIDTGSGVPAEIRRRIFEPCFTTKRDGTGLGLAAVKRTASEYHGRISFRTRSGRGSKFTLALPLRSQLNLTEIPK
jgi:PAS domain S-box-containing protein